MSERLALLESERRNEALVRLQEASAGLLGLEGEAPSSDRLIEIFCHVTGAPRGVYWLLDEAAAGTPTLVAQGMYGVRRVPRNDVDRRMQELLLRVELASEHPAAVAARTMLPVVLPDTQTDDTWTELSELWHRTGIRSLLAVPLRARGRLLGVVVLTWREEERSAEEPTVRTAEVIANQVASALDTAALVEELSRANRLKDEFLATLSHELRHPLGVILSYAEILAGDAEAQRLAVVRKAAETIRRNVRTQERLIADLLDLSRLQTGKLAIHRQPVQLAPLLTEVAEAVRAETDLKRIELRLEETAEPLAVEADPVRLQQVLWNLLQNAVKFTPEGGRVTARLQRVGGEACLSVEDTGQGLEPALLPNLFQMFRQADSRANIRHGGLGIGLALVRQLVELHGGRVQAESEGPGRGARFTVWLPLAQGGLPAAPHL